MQPEAARCAQYAPLNRPGGVHAPLQLAALDIELGLRLRRRHYSGWLPSFPPVVETPEQHLAPADEANHARRLKKQEGDDERTVDDGIQIAARNAAGAGALRLRERFEYLREREDEDRAQDGPPDTGHAADENGGDELNGEDKIPCVGGGKTGIRGQQGSRDAGQERRQNERAHLDFKQIDAHDGRTRFIVAHGPHRATGPRAHDVANEDRRHRQHHQQQQEVQLIARKLDAENGNWAGEREAAEARRGERPPLRAAGDAAHVEEEIVADEDQGERYDSQVKAFQTQRRGANERTGERGDDTGGGEPDEERETQTGGIAF